MKYLVELGANYNEKDNVITVHPIYWLDMFINSVTYCVDGFVVHRMEQRHFFMLQYTVRWMP
jgi:hypothetical protein